MLIFDEQIFLIDLIIEFLKPVVFYAYFNILPIDFLNFYNNRLKPRILQLV